MSKSDPFDYAGAFSLDIQIGSRRLFALAYLVTNQRACCSAAYGAQSGTKQCITDHAAGAAPTPVPIWALVGEVEQPAMASVKAADTVMARVRSFMRSLLYSCQRGQLS
jgi:hypothetical protein